MQSKIKILEKVFFTSPSSDLTHAQDARLTTPTGLAHMTMNEIKYAVFPANWQGRVSQTIINTDIPGRCCAEFCTLPDYAPPSIGRLRVRCGGGVRIRGGVGIRQSGSDFNEGMHNLAGVQISAQHRNAHFQRRITDCSIVFKINTYVNLTCFLNVCKHIMVFLCFSRVKILHTAPLKSFDFMSSDCRFSESENKFGVLIWCLRFDLNLRSGRLLQKSTWQSWDIVCDFPISYD